MVVPPVWAGLRARAEPWRKEAQAEHRVLLVPVQAVCLEREEPRASAVPELVEAVECWVTGERRAAGSLERRPVARQALVEALECPEVAKAVACPEAERLALSPGPAERGPVARPALAEAQGEPPEPRARPALQAVHR